MLSDRCEECNGKVFSVEVVVMSGKRMFKERRVCEVCDDKELVAFGSVEGSEFVKRAVDNGWLTSWDDEEGEDEE